jgi:putative ABC transport system permease protein
MQSVLQDVRYGLRGLWKEPAFTFLAVFTLALGIAASTTIFSVIQNVLLDPFPYRDPDRVAALQIRDPARPRGGGRSFFQTPEWLDYREQLQSFEDVIGGGFEDVLYSTGEGTEQFAGALMTGNTFEFLGVPALLGRTLLPDDARPSAPPVFAMSYKLWAARFGSDPGIVGRSFVLNGVPTTLVGIMPARFTKQAADLYRPVVLDRADLEGRERFLLFQGRLKPGVTLDELEAEARIVAERLATVYPRNYPEKFTVKAVSWLDNVIGQFRKTLYTLAAAVGLLLLIACANVANMLLTRATVRERELAVRASLGASRGRLVRQLLVESLLVAVLGAVTGCLMAWLGLPALVRAIPEGLIPREAVIRLNLPVLLFSLGVALVTSLVCGLLPALRAAGRDIASPLKDSGKGTTAAGARGRRLNDSLVVLEVALSLVLLAGAGLLMRSFVKLQTQELGFNPEGMLHARIPLPRGQYREAEEKRVFFRQVLDRVEALPGVVSATVTSSLPSFGGIRSEVEVAGKAHTERWEAIYTLCSEGYFQTMGLRLRRGRLLSPADLADSRRVAVVNQALVGRFFGEDDPIGRTIELKHLATLANSPVASPVFEVIGVVADAKNQGLQDPVMPEAFVPHAITGSFERGILVRTSTEPMALLESVKREVWGVDRNVALTMTDSIASSLRRFAYAEPRFSLVVLGIFAGVGLVLVALGVFSVVAYTVSRRTHEIGIRMALGADRGDVLGLVLRTGFRLVGIGIVAGALASLAAARVLANQLFGIPPHDVVTLVSVAGVVALAGLLACYFPARRATRVAPIIALRS